MTLHRLCPVLLLIGVGLLVPFETPVTLVLGVAALLGFVVTGVFAVATPEFLEDDDVG
jgi:Na+-transporting methylmalonyl-CoA/oxaloacetate decarboxylase beta subunit